MDQSMEIVSEDLIDNSTVSHASERLNEENPQESSKKRPFDHDSHGNAHKKHGKSKFKRQKQKHVPLAQETTPGNKAFKKSLIGLTEEQVLQKKEEAKKKEEEKAAERAEIKENEPRVAKRKAAIMMGYCGSGYKGMQINPGTKTIEAELFDALVATKCISTLNSDDTKKVDLSRAARTDKGVHALGQCVSIMLQRIEHLDSEHGPKVERELVKEINNKLPEQIRVWGIKKMPKSFHAKTSCDSRWYEYVLPTFLFVSPPKLFYPGSNLPDDTSEYYPFPAVSDKVKGDGKSVRITYYDLPGPKPEQMEKLRSFRCTPEQVEKLREGILKYKGTHNFHNFTIGKRFEEASSKRNMIELKVSDPFVRDETEWISVRLWGQSFMLHQIRKMIGLIVMTIRTNTSLDIVDLAMTKTRLNIPKAPAVGLLLDRVVYVGYNKRLQQLHEHDVAKAKKDGKELKREANLLNFDGYEAEMDAFREAWIYPKVFDGDRKNNFFIDWIRSVDSHGPEYSWYLRQDGKVDDQARPSYVFAIKEDEDEMPDE